MNFVAALLLTVLLHTALPAATAPLEVIKQRYFYKGNEGHVAAVDWVLYTPSEDHRSLYVEHLRSSYKPWLKRCTKSLDVARNYTIGSWSYKRANLAYQSDLQLAKDHNTTITSDFIGFRKWHATDHILSVNRTKIDVRRIMVPEDGCVMLKIYESN